MTVEIDANSDIRTIEIKKIAVKNESTCNSCKNNMSRIKRGGFVKTFLFFLPLKRYACYNCRTKTYRWSKKNA